MGAISGAGGDIELRRQFPDPVVLPAAAFSGGALYLLSDQLFPLDPVLLVHSGGVISGYLHLDELNRVTLHSTVRGALNNDAATRLSLSGVSGTTVLALEGTSGQTTALTTFLSGLAVAPTAETILRAWPAASSSYRAAGTNRTVWRKQGQVTTWRLRRRANPADVSTLGNVYGEGIKAAITGSGTLEFMIDLYSGAERESADPLLRVLQMIERGVVDARLYLKRESLGELSPDCTDRTGMGAALFYRARLLIIEDETDCSTQDIVQGTLDFATTGPIRLGSDVLP